MNFTNGLKSSNTDEWETPADLFNSLNEEFGFTLDVCANENNHKCPKYYDKAIDGLKQNWYGEVCWMNPPYGRSISKWVKKAAETAMGGGRSGCTVTSTHGYPRVGLCDACNGITLYPWPCEVWKIDSRRTIPQCHSDMGNAYETSYQNDMKVV